MRFRYAIVYVSDVEKTVDFYERAFGLTRRFVDEDGWQYAEMETGETLLAFASNEAGEANFPGGFRRNDPNEAPAGVEIAFLAEDVGAAFATALEAGAEGMAEAKVMPWGQTVAYVRDLNGVLVEICNEVGVS